MKKSIAILLVLLLLLPVLSVQAFAADAPMSWSLMDGGVLVISNFTLCADCSHGRRPSFIGAARPETARPLYEYFCGKLLENGVSRVERGIFGADMQVSLVNDGPVTIDINSKDLKR